MAADCDDRGGGAAAAVAHPPGGARRPRSRPRGGDRAFALDLARRVARCAGAGVDAQTVPTETDGIAKLSADSRRVRAIRSGIEVARAEVLAASRWPNPRLYVGRESVAGVSEVITSVLQPLPITGQRRFEIQLAFARLRRGIGSRSSRASSASASAKGTPRASIACAPNAKCSTSRPIA